MLTTSTMGKRISTAALLLLLGLAPAAANADVTVAEPTGDAEPAFLAELKASLETVAAEAAADVDAELKASAAFTDAGVELIVELAPNDGKSPIRETRTASTASALAQARAMGRAAVQALEGSTSGATEPTAPAPVLAVTVPQPEEVTPPPEPEPEPPPPPPPPPLPEKYNRRTVMLVTALPPTILISGAWAAGLVGAVMEAPFIYSFGTVPFASGAALIWPTTGYFYIGRWKHALIMTGVRAALIGGAVIADVYMVKEGFRHDEYLGSECKEAPCSDHRDNTAAVFSALLLGAMSVVTIADSFLVGRATDKVNEEYRKSLVTAAAPRRNPTVAFAPMAWSNGNGDGTFGLAVSGTF